MDFEQARKAMVETQLQSRGIRDKKVLKAFLKVPRERFIPEDMRAYAYEDGPVSIGQGQTISQPYIVALMTEALELSGADKVLEIGLGSGYQSAILAEIGAEVYSVERIPVLAEKAGWILKELGYQVHIKVGDGTLGWPEFAPYDRIMVTAAGPRVPASLISQMQDTGKLIMPVGDLFSQDLILVTKKGRGTEKKNLGGCQFVPLKGEEGWKE